jgi:hypothetical protein
MITEEEYNLEKQHMADTAQQSQMDALFNEGRAKGAEYGTLYVKIFGKDKSSLNRGLTSQNDMMKGE